MGKSSGCPTTAPVPYMLDKFAKIVSNFKCFQMPSYSLSFISSEQGSDDMMSPEVWKLEMEHGLYTTLCGKKSLTSYFTLSPQINIELLFAFVHIFPNQTHWKDLEIKECIHGE